MKFAVNASPMALMKIPFPELIQLPHSESLRRIRLLFAFLVLVSSPTAYARTVTENIFFIQPDGKSYLNYSTTRSSHESYNLFLKKAENESQFDYIYPNDYVFDGDSDPERNVITFKQGSYATLRPGSFEHKIAEENGVFNFVNWDESRDEKLPGGFYGEWTAPDNFSQYVYAWVLPDNLEVISFETNHPKNGVWRLRRSTLAWYGQDVNNIVFKIKYRAKTSETASALRSSLTAPDNGRKVSISAETSEVRVVLSDQVLFPSGSADLSEAGQQVLGKLAASLKDASENHFIVEGHTDNAPINGSLKERFASNWELSAARSLAVVSYLQQSGIDGQRLESRSYGEFQPTASNETPEGRAENRRIEIRIITAH